jgi:hypothetical protein
MNRDCKRVAPKSSGRNPESGYALLFIYAMAAIVAIMLYNEIPRVAFEAQRDKEQLLIDRGEQYSRAVNLYVRKFNKFPADFDALQSTQNLRFLRHRYIDPMTGKDDWRIIHVGPGGVFTDSLVYGKKKDGAQQTAEQQTFITELQPVGGNQIDPNQNVNVGMRQRQSDQPGAPGAPDPNNSLNNAPNNTIQPYNPAQPPQLDSNGQPLPNGLPPSLQPGQPGLQTAQPPGFPGGVPGQPFPGGFPGQPGGMPGQSANQPGTGPPSAAANLIGQILTTPRPGGLNGLGGVQQGTTDPNAQGGNTATIGSPGTVTAAAPTATAAQTIGGGMAGVASKLEEDGIKIYKDQKSYHKWEFVYDITKDPARTGGGAVPAGAPPPGTPIGAAPGAPNAATPAATGTPAPNSTATPVPPVTPSQ